MPPDVSLRMPTADVHRLSRLNRAEPIARLQVVRRKGGHLRERRVEANEARRGGDA